MDNTESTTPSETTANIDNVINPESLTSSVTEPVITSNIESTISNPLEHIMTTTEPVEQTNIDGNVQAHVDIKYEAHDVALESVKANGNQQSHNDLTSSEHQKIEINEYEQHPDKSKSYCSMLNKFYLALAIVCFTLFLCSITYIINNFEKLDRKRIGRISSQANLSRSMGDYQGPMEKLSDEKFFTLMHNNQDGIRVVLSRRGASVYDILIPTKNGNGLNKYRSIIVKDLNEKYFGSIRFGFDDPKNATNMTGQLPDNYQFSKLHKEDWSMYTDTNNPYRVRFAYNSIQVIYELSSINPNEFRMTTIATPLPNQQVVVDITNNIYFNLRSYGNLSTHYLNLTSSYPLNITNAQKVEQDRLIQPQRVDKLMNNNRYFYKLDRVGIGKNYIATLNETETKTIMRVFSDHAGVVIDPFGVGVSNQDENLATTKSETRGVRISPRQSPIYQPIPIYGQTLLIYPSQAIHRTWWQFDYES